MQKTNSKFLLIFDFTFITILSADYYCLSRSKGQGKCLQDRPEEMEEYEYPELPAGAMYNGDYQCRFQFGSDATVCSPLDEICSRLWCSINDTCTTLLKPAAPGTSCGKHKVRGINIGRAESRLPLPSTSFCSRENGVDLTKRYFDSS